MQKAWVKHLWFWIPYMILEVYTESYWMGVQYQQPFWSTFYHAFLEEVSQILVIKIPMVYLMLYFINRFAHQTRKIWQLILSLTATLLIFSVLGYWFLIEFVVRVIYAHLEIVGLGGFGTLVNSFMDKIFVASVVIALSEYLYSQKLRQRESELLKEKVETELNFLKSQINPHFLFNTLNNIYALARKKSDETPEVVLKLSKLLRFVLYEAEAKLIPISREIEFLHDYIDLQKIRFGDRLDLTFKHQIDNAHQEISPLILIPFVENAFKHGASQSTEKSYIHIDLKVREKILKLKVENSLETNSDIESEGIGLKNLRRQLELTYKDFELKNASKYGIHQAELKLDLNTKR